MRDRVRVAALVAAVAVLLLGTGCATFGAFETARTAAPGKFQIGGALTPLNIFSQKDEKTTTLFFPFPTLFGKMGVSERLDLGASWSFGPGIGFNGKYQFIRGATDGALALSGSFYGIAVEDASVGFYSLGPRLIFSGEQEGSFPYMLNVGATYSGVAAGADGESASGGALLGLAGAGLPFRLGTTRTVRMMPEVQVSAPVMTTFESGGDENTTLMLESFVISVGVSIAYVGAER